MGYVNLGSQRSFAALASDTSANGTARNGTALAVNLAHPGTISVLCAGSIDTSSVIATYKVQVSQDGSTYYDLKTLNNASSVATAAGTGSTVAHSFVLDVPVSASGWRYLRAVATLSGATTDPADVTSATVRYLVADDIFA
jgi:hypothetical protein